MATKHPLIRIKNKAFRKIFDFFSKGDLNLFLDNRIQRTGFNFYILHFSQVCIIFASLRLFFNCREIRGDNERPHVIGC